MKRLIWIIATALMFMLSVSAFAQSAGYQYVVVPEGTKEIQARAFAGSSVTRVDFPASLTYIAPNAFEGVSGLSACVRPDSYAMQYCQT